jgi:pimeloyl-ACP methyl ester carboxylesterase
MQHIRYNKEASVVDNDPALAKARKRRASEKKGAIMTAHGIWTDGAWQENLSYWIQHAGYMAGRVDYGKHLWTTPLPFRLNSALHTAEEKYDQLEADYPGNVSVIAHSYGTLTIANLLTRKPAIRFKRIIFFCSVVDRAFPWPTLHDNAQFIDFLHEFGGADIWPRVAPVGFALLRNAGNSGAYGFDRNNLTHFHQFRYPDLTHSDLQTVSQFRNVWIPFVQNGCSALTISAAYSFPGRIP